MSSDIIEVDAVIFDMDGVLLDTEPLYLKAMTSVCQELDCELSEGMHAACIGVPADATDRLMLTYFGENFPLQAYKSHVNQMMQELTATGIPVKRGVLDLLKCLEKRGIPTAVATSTARPTAPDRLNSTGLLPYFKTVVTRNDVSVGKPHPEPYLTAVERLGMDPARCMALEDSHNGVRSAVAAGLYTIMVPDLLAPTAEIEGLCHAILPSLAHVQSTYFNG